MDEKTRLVLYRMLIKLEQRVEILRELVLDCIGDQAKHDAASREFEATINTVQEIEKKLSGDN
jgi:hypothetical protein